MIHFGWIRREWLALHESDAKYFMVCIYIVAPSMKLSFFEKCIEIFTSMGGQLVRTNSQPHRPSEMIHFGWIRREWLALHESDARYFMVCIYIVAPSMKLSFFEQCIEIFTSMGVGELVRTHPPTRPSIRNDPFWLDT